MLFSFPENLYVGFQESGLDTTNPPLAFITPYGTDKAFEKRKETVWNWCNNNTWQRTNQLPKIDPVILDNVELSGYTLDTVVERYSTSNKVFRINDPRGFQFEIYADNLADILLNGEVRNGRLIGKYIFARIGANNFLMRDDHPVNIERKNPSFNRPLKVGDMVSMSGGREKSKMLFCGMFYKAEFYIHRNLGKINETVMRITKSNKPVMVFYNVENIFGYTNLIDLIYIVNNTNKYRIISEGHATDVVTIGIGKILVNYLHGIILLETKKELDEFNPNKEKCEAAFGMKIDVF